MFVVLHVVLAPMLYRYPIYSKFSRNMLLLWCCCCCGWCPFLRVITSSRHWIVSSFEVDGCRSFFQQQSVIFFSVSISVSCLLTLLPSQSLRRSLSLSLSLRVSYVYTIYRRGAFYFSFILSNFDAFWCVCRKRHVSLSRQPVGVLEIKILVHFDWITRIFDGARTATESRSLY